MTENEWRDKIVIPFLKKLPHTYYFIKQADSIRGIPDIIVCLNGKFVVLEIKKSESSLSHPRSKLQGYTIQLVHHANGRGFFVYPENWEDVKEELLELT